MQEGLLMYLNKGTHAVELIKMRMAEHFGYAVCKQSCSVLRFQSKENMGSMSELVSFIDN